MLINRLFDEMVAVEDDTLRPIKVDTSTMRILHIKFNISDIG